MCDGYSSAKIGDHEINSINNFNLIKASIENSDEWKATLTVFDSIIEFSDILGAKVFLVYIPNRGTVYYEKSTGKKLPNRHHNKIESELLRKFSNYKNISFIDVLDPLVKYVNSLRNDTSLKDYPFLEIDAHMSAKGYKIVAEEIMANIKQSESTIF